MMRRSFLSASRAISRTTTSSTHSRALTTSTPQLSAETTSATTTPSSDAPPPQTQSRSSVAAGTVLKGLNYFKNKQDPVALEDHEYPAWLWHVLDEKPKSAAEGQKQEMDPRLFAKSARARQKANKALRLQEKRNPAAGARPIPIYQQAIDLPAGKGVTTEVAQQGREDLTKAMRTKRRRDIKEGNFLKSMS